MWSERPLYILTCLVDQTEDVFSVAFELSRLLPESPVSSLKMGIHTSSIWFEKLPSVFLLVKGRLPCRHPIRDCVSAVMTRQGSEYSVCSKGDRGVIGSRSKVQHSNFTFHSVHTSGSDELAVVELASTLFF